VQTMTATRTTPAADVAIMIVGPDTDREPGNPQHLLNRASKALCIVEFATTNSKHQRSWRF
jgi:hypothetical protein